VQDPEDLSIPIRILEKMRLLRQMFCQAMVVMHWEVFLLNKEEETGSTLCNG
jgi:hypothetical protein